MDAICENVTTGICMLLTYNLKVQMEVIFLFFFPHLDCIYTHLAVLVTALGLQTQPFRREKKNGE